MLLSVFIETAILCAYLTLPLLMLPRWWKWYSFINHLRCAVTTVGCAESAHYAAALLLVVAAAV